MAIIPVNFRLGLRISWNITSLYRLFIFTKRNLFDSKIHILKVLKNSQIFMSLWILSALIGVLWFSLSNVTQKALSKRFHAIEWLVFQYAFLALFGWIYLWWREGFSFVVTLTNVLLILVCGIIGYLWVFFFSFDDFHIFQLELSFRYHFHSPF